MMKKIYHCKKGRLLPVVPLSYIMILFIVLLCSSIPAVTMDDHKLIITIQDNNEPYNGVFQLTPIDSDIIDDIMMMDHVQEVIPVVTRSYGMNFSKRPPGNFTDAPSTIDDPFPGELPHFDDSFHRSRPEWNKTFLDRDLSGDMNEMVDYIIEGVSLESLSTYTFYSIPSTVLSGRSLQPADSCNVYIGEDAQNYFNVSVGGQINIGGSSFTVIGIFQDKNYSKYVYMDITDARALLQLQDSEVNTLYVYIDESDSLESVGKALQEGYPSISIRYNGIPAPFKSQGQPYQYQPYNDPIGIGTELYTSGFEGILLITIVSGFVMYKKLSKGRNPP